MNSNPIASPFLQYFKNHRFTIFLTALMLFFILAPFFENEFLVDLFTTGIIVFAVLGVSEHRKLLMVCAVLGATSVVLLWSESFFPDMAFMVVVFLLVEIVYYLLIIGSILTFVFRAHPVNREKLAAAVCAYLLFGFLWANVYAGLEALKPGSFSGQVLVASTDSSIPSFRRQVSQFGYFSLVTLSTLGYGDIAPLTKPARNFAAMEAIFGQLYLALLIARLVSQHVSLGSRDDA